MGSQSGGLPAADGGRPQGRTKTNGDRARPPPPVFAFQGSRSHHAPTSEQPKDDERKNFSFRNFVDHAPRFPESEPRRAAGHHLARRQRDPDRRDRRERDVYRPQGSRRGPPAPSDRPLLQSRRASTPERLAGMNGELATSERFLIDDVNSESSEVEQESDYEPTDELPIAGAEDQDADHPDGPPRKRKALAADVSTQDGQPKWSNPDPYTVLPPVDETQRKKKDVVKLIRKARIEIKPEIPANNAVSDNHDFISFDLGGDDEDGRQSRDERHEASQSDHRSPVRLRADRPPGSRDRYTTASSLGPPPSSLPPRPQGRPVVNSRPRSSADETLGNRKRTHDDEIKSENARPAKRKSEPSRHSVNGMILEAWKASDNSGTATPWLADDHSTTSSVGLWLHQEICDFYNFVRPKDFENVVRNELLQRLQRLLSSELAREFGECQVHSFGSFAAGIYLPTADMDVVVLSPRYLQTKVPQFKKGTLYSVRNLLGRIRMAAPKSILVIANAKVPLVKFVDATTGLRVDLSFDNESGVIANGTFQSWKAQHPAMPVIVTLVKQFLAMRGLADNAQGGLGGFSVTCLVTSLFQLMPQVQAGQLDPARHLGDMLMEFFLLYGKKFNPDIAGVSLNPPGYFEKRKNPLNLPYNAKNKNRLSIADPNRAGNDISGGSYEIQTVLEMFSEAYDVLHQTMHRLRLTNIADRKGQSILGSLFAGNYSSFSKQRSRLQSLYEQQFGPIQTSG